MGKRDSNSNQQDDLSWEQEAERLGMESLVRLIFAIVGLLLLLVLLALVPGLDLTIPGLPITYIAVVSSLIALIIVLLLLQAAPKVRALMQEALALPSDVTEPLASLTYWLFLFLAVVVAYEGLAPTIQPILADTDLVWIYDLGFFLLGAVPLLLVAYNGYRSLNPMTEYFTDQVQVESKSTSHKSDAEGPAAEDADASDDESRD